MDLIIDYDNKISMNHQWIFSESSILMLLLFLLKQCCYRAKLWERNVLTTCPIFMRRNINDSFILHFQWLHRSFFCYCYLLPFWSAVEKFHFTFFADSWGALLIEMKSNFCFLLGINLFLFSWAKKSTLRICFIFKFGILLCMATIVHVFFANTAMETSKILF